MNLHSFSPLHQTDKLENSQAVLWSGPVNHIEIEPRASGRNAPVLIAVII